MPRTPAQSVSEPSAGHHRGMSTQSQATGFLKSVTRKRGITKGGIA